MHPVIHRINSVGKKYPTNGVYNMVPLMDTGRPT